MNLDQDHKWMPDRLDEKSLGVMKRVNIEGLPLSSLEVPAGNLACTQELRLQEGFNHSQNGEEWLTVCTQFVQTMWVMLNASFFPGSLDFSMCSAEDAYMTSPQ